ncbi:ROK family transcriptional regulator [Brachybacterium endophyticum]|nr:ROK family transcriptional regulator [Brachybacterium endophyticum]
MPDIGAKNELVVLDAIRNAPEGSSQSEVVRRSGLSRQAVSLITRRLMERGLVETDGTRGEGRGKPRTVLRVSPSSLLAAGVHLDPAGISLVMVDLGANVVAERAIGPPGTDPDAGVHRIAEGLEELLASLHGEGWHSPSGQRASDVLLGIGVAAPGGLDSRRGVLVDPPWMPGWWNSSLAEMLSHATGRPAVLDKDTNAALAAEIWAGDRLSEQTVLYIYVSAGIGSAVASRGRVQRGSTTQAGEIGHLPTGLDGPLCGCGRRACLSVFTDVRAMLSRFDAAGTGTGPGTTDPSEVADDGERLDALLAAATAGDPLGSQIAREHGTALGEALRTLIGIHDPHRVIIGGPYWRALEPLSMPHVLERAMQGNGGRRGVTISSSAFGDDVGAIGAATLYLGRELSPTVR